MATSLRLREAAMPNPPVRREPSAKSNNHTSSLTSAFCRMDKTFFVLPTRRNAQYAATRGHIERTHPCSLTHKRRGQVLHYSNPKARSPFYVPYRLAYCCVLHFKVIRDLLSRVAPCAQAMGSFIIASHFSSPITRVGKSIKYIV